jgi:hypothetical protein
VGVAGAQHRGDDLPRLAIEDQQRMVHVLPKVAVVGAPVLLAMGRIVGAIEVEHDPPRDSRPLALVQVDRSQRLGQPVAVPGRQRVLEAREGWLAGQVGVALGQPPAHQLQQRIVAQGVGVVLVFIAGGDLVDALAQQLQRRVTAAAASVRNRRRQRGTQSQRLIGFGDPRPAPITGQPTAQKIDRQRRGNGWGEDEWLCGRLGHAGHLLVVVGQHLYRYQMGASLSLMNNSG